MHKPNATLDALLQTLDTNHATDTVVIDVSQQTAIADFIIVCTARSSRHVRAITQHVITAMKSIPLTALGHHGTTEGEWALIDFADYLVNIMLPTARDFYNLEALWQPALAKTIRN